MFKIIGFDRYGWNNETMQVINLATGKPLNEEGKETDITTKRWKMTDNKGSRKYHYIKDLVLDENTEVVVKRRTREKRKFKPDEIKDIREKWSWGMGMKQKDIAEEYDVDQSTISEICNAKLYSDIPLEHFLKTENTETNE